MSNNLDYPMCSISHLVLGMASFFLRKNSEAVGIIKRGPVFAEKRVGQGAHLTFWTPTGTREGRPLNLLGKMSNDEIRMTRECPMTNDESLTGHNFVIGAWSFRHSCIDLCHLIQDWLRHAGTGRMALARSDR
jgi:hypothetical protein